MLRSCQPGIPRRVVHGTCTLHGQSRDQHLNLYAEEGNRSWGQRAKTIKGEIQEWEGLLGSSLRDRLQSKEHCSCRLSFEATAERRNWEWFPGTRLPDRLKSKNQWSNHVSFCMAGLQHVNYMHWSWEQEKWATQHSLVLMYSFILRPFSTYTPLIDRK